MNFSPQSYYKAWNKNLARGRIRRRKYQKQPIKSIVKDVAYLKGLINVEFKYHDVQFAQDAHTTGAIVPLNLVPQDDTGVGRDGNQFRMKSVQIRGLSKNKTASTTPIFTKIDLILDTEPCAGTTPLFTDIYDTTGAVPYYRALRNLDNRHRFVFLKSWSFVHDPTGQEAKIIDFYKKLDVKVLFANSTATLANLKKHHLFLAISGNNASGSGNEGVVECQTRIRYLDN